MEANNPKVAEYANFNTCEYDNIYFESGTVS